MYALFALLLLLPKRSTRRSALGASDVPMHIKALIVMGVFELVVLYSDVSLAALATPTRPDALMSPRDAIGWALLGIVMPHSFFMSHESPRKDWYDTLGVVAMYLGLFFVLICSVVLADALGCTPWL